MLWYQKLSERLGPGMVVDERPDGARGGAAGRFDLDHVGAHVGQELPRELAELVAEFDDAESGEWAAHMNTPIASCSANSSGESPRTSGHHLGRVLTDERGGGAQGAGRGREPGRDAVELACFAHLRVGHACATSRGHGAARPVRTGRRGVWQTPAGTPAAWSSMHQRVVLAGRGPGRDARVEVVLVCEAAGVGGEARIRGPGGFAHRAHHRLPLGVVADGDGEPAVLAGAGVGVVGGDGGLPGAVAGRHACRGASCGR